MKQFNKNAQAYDIVRKKITYPNTLYSSLSSRAPTKEAALDIGCGNGISTVRLQELFDHVEGCDIGDSLIDKARQNYPDILFNVSPAETFSPSHSFDLITSATSFYWMDRETIFMNLREWLKPGGLFCAYKYDFPVVYGPLRNYIELELVTHWSRYRDPRLIRYDNTLELMCNYPHLRDTRRELFANIISLTPEEVALFFLSTSYVTRYIEEEGGEMYAHQFMEMVTSIDKSSSVSVNFDIHAFTAVKR
ncbi:class I SAM-dependent methyltransferase [Xenorhabdus sp. PR6a]|uniref:class I SAM-dependent methyltransferase n=1 Tax=Xenorhabdus sp. PR6a TaxID=3025877 RepID=UPI002359B8ED|nr:class I SAM-dependent methyltransferase [Xenorhabdus sp. PR6a]MDC9581604.1 class I SAM-dependent methyltransferase [Xenorhabdus sp. PR6a]